MIAGVADHVGERILDQLHDLVIQLGRLAFHDQFDLLAEVVAGVAWAVLLLGEVLAKELVRKTAKTVELRSLNPEHEDVQFPLTDVVWIARIVWATQ